MSPLVTEDQKTVEAMALRVFDSPAVRAAREAVRPKLLADPLAKTPIGIAGLDRALDQWTRALAMRQANFDPFRPKIIWSVDNTPRTWFGQTFLGAAVAVDNPDNCNREIPIDGASAYELNGRYGDPASAQFNLNVETAADHGGIGDHVATTTNKLIKAAPDGTFTVTLDTSPAGDRPNHIQIKPGRQWLFSRDSMSSWLQNPTALSIRRVSGPEAPPPATEAEVIARTAERLDAFVDYWMHFKDGFLGSPQANVIVGPTSRDGGWGYMAGGRLKLAADETLVVITTDGGADYTGFQVSDPWTIAPDPVLHISSLNKSQAKATADGRYVYAIALSDPGIHNWINPVGLSEGWFLLRWQNVPDGSVPTVEEVRLVKLADLEAALPAGTPRADLASRREQVAQRAATYHRRSDDGHGG